MRKIRLKIGDLRAKRGLTQIQLSDMTGIRQAAISELESGDRRRVDISHLARIADALEINDINEILEITEEKDAGQ